MRFDEATKQFLAYCDLERGFSPCTIAAYASDLRQWRRFLAKAIPGNIPRITDVNRQLIRKFIVHQREAGLSNATVVRRVNCLRSFWQFLDQAELVTDNPIDGIRLPKTRTELPNYLTDEEMRRLLDAAGRTHYANLASRDGAVIGMFLFAGLRRQELINVHVPDVNWEDGIIRVRHGKGGRMRVIPMVRELQDFLEAWLTERPQCHHDFLFSNREKQPLATRAVALTFKRAERMADMDRPEVAVHTLHHSFACALLHGGPSVVAIRRSMGHASLDTTLIYLHVTGVELEEAVAAHSLCGAK